jgi:hypothetical protein
MSSPPWHVAKVMVRGVPSYELWNDGRPAMVGRFSTFAAAKREAEREQLGMGSLTAGGE